MSERKELGKFTLWDFDGMRIDSLVEDLFKIKIQHKDQFNDIFLELDWEKEPYEEIQRVFKVIGLRK